MGSMPKDKIRVAVVIPRYIPVFGGAENQCRILNSKLLASGKIEIPFLVTKHIKNDLKRKEIIDHIPIRRLGIAGINRWCEYYFYLLMFFYLILNRNKFDIIHCHATSIVGFVATLASRLVKKPIILKLSTNGELINGLYSPNRKKTIVKNLLKNVRNKLAYYTTKHAHTVALNQEGLEELRRSGANNPNVIRNGTDIEVFKPLSATERKITRTEFGFSDDDFVFLFTGRFVVRKGIDILLTSFNNFSAQLASGSVRLCLVGSGELQNDSIENDLSGKSKFIIKYPPTKNIIRFLQIADAFVFPSYREGLPNSVLEAMAVGLPCVLSDIRPHCELIDDNPSKYHYLFESGNANALAEAMAKCYQQCKSMDYIQSNVILTKSYYINNVTQRYFELYEKIIQSRDI